MKIKRSELKQIIQEEIETTAIEEGLWDTIVGGTIQGGHDAAKRAMSIVNLALGAIKAITDVQHDFPHATASQARKLTGQHLRRDGTLAPWDAPMDIVARAKERDPYLNPSHKERHIKILKDLIYKYPSNKKIALALTALETLDKSLTDIVAAAKADFDADRAIDHAAAEAKVKEFWAQIAQGRAERERAVRARERAAAAAEPKPTGHMAGLVPQIDLGRTPTDMERSGRWGAGTSRELEERESIENTDLYGIIQEELQAVLAEMKDKQ